MTSYIKGLFYEFLSIICLFFKGHKILAWRYKTPVGEIDIISYRRNVIFVHEVKFRKKLDDAYAIINKKLETRLTRTYYWWIKTNPKFAHCTIQIKYIFWHNKFMVKYL
ncbi:MAG: YraN family protein [Alphaproteobacteria bacterium]|nr:MAG: YraN family protein [Alphaproteobacteria bacterium]